MNILFNRRITVCGCRDGDQWFVRHRRSQHPVDEGEEDLAHGHRMLHHILLRAHTRDPGRCSVFHFYQSPNYTERQKKLITSSERRSRKSTA